MSVADTKRFPKWLQFAKYVAKAHLGVCRFLTLTCAQSAVGAQTSSACVPSSKALPVGFMPALLALSLAKSSRLAVKTHAGRR